MEIETGGELVWCNKEIVYTYFHEIYTTASASMTMNLHLGIDLGN